MLNVRNTELKSTSVWRRTFLFLGFALGWLLLAAAAAAIGSLRDGDAVHAPVLKITVHVRLILLALRNMREKLLVY